MFTNNCPWAIHIPGFDIPYWITYPGVMKGKYTITKMGTVVNVEKNYVVSQFVNGGYLKCNLVREDGLQYPYPIHRLMAWEFVFENRDLNLTVNHKDGNKFNNNPFNLEWISAAENTAHAWRTGLVPENLNQGEAHGMAKLTDNDVHLICNMLKDPTISYDQILNVIDHKISKQTLSEIALRNGWNHITKNYNIPHRDQTGENHPMAKLDNEKVHEICRLLEDPNNSYEYIASLFEGVCSIHAIIDIAHGRTWTNISSQYVIPHRPLKGIHAGEKHNMAKLTNEDVHLICQLLQDTDLKYREIVERLDNKISIDTISAIFKGKVWNHISYQYDFSKRMK